MAVYYKLTFEGQAEGQSIVNIMYYGADDGSAFLDYSEPIAQDLLDTAGETFVTDYVASLPLAYTLNQLRVSSVDERGVANSPYDLLEIVNEPGIQGGALSGAYNVAILPFTTNVAPDAGRNLKRSYLAYGPIVETFIDPDQSLTAAFLGLVSPLMLALRSNLVGGIQEYAPVRIGRTVAPQPVAVGVVRSIAMAPYASVRKSRKKTPRGT